MSIALMAVTSLLLAYSTVSGFHYNGTALANAPIPFISVAHGVVAWQAFIAYLAGMTSTLGVLIAAPGAAVLLPEVPAGRVQSGQARRAAGPRHVRHRRPRLLPVQAAAA